MEQDAAPFTVTKHKLKIKIHITVKEQVPAMEEYCSPATTYVSKGASVFNSHDSTFGDVLQRAPANLESC